MNEIAVADHTGKTESLDLDLLRRTIAKDLTGEEFALFAAQCQRSGLDPFASQICAVKRKNRDGAQMTIQVQIHGLRLIADRTQRYAPGSETRFTYDERNCLRTATAYVRKLVGATWIEFCEVAHWAEYVQAYNDGNPMGLWKTKPHVMLAKCAEALALRRGFPQETSGYYIPEEMGADAADVTIIEATAQPVRAELPPAAETPKLRMTATEEPIPLPGEEPKPSAPTVGSVKSRINGMMIELGRDLDPEGRAAKWSSGRWAHVLGKKSFSADSTEVEEWIEVADRLGKFVAFWNQNNMGDPEQRKAILLKWGVSHVADISDADMIGFVKWMRTGELPKVAAE